MNFVLFPVGSTNIFPIVNSHAGGQYATEWNLRSRESVGTDPSVRYHIGPSYAHSAEDFAISQQLDGTGVPISSTSLQISEGRALVNGHFVESLAPIVIDIASLVFPDLSVIVPAGNANVIGPLYPTPFALSKPLITN